MRLTPYSLPPQEAAGEYASLTARCSLALEPYLLKVVALSRGLGPQARRLAPAECLWLRGAHVVDTRQDSPVVRCHRLRRHVSFGARWAQLRRLHVPLLRGGGSARSRRLA